MVDKSRFGLYSWFFCVVTVLSLAAVVAWLSLTPRNPSFRISGSNFPTPDSRNHSTYSNVSIPNGSLIFNLEIFNPNKRMGIYYSGINWELYKGGGVVVRNSTTGFYQRQKNTTVFQIPIHGSQELWQEMNGGRSKDLLIRVKTSVIFRIIKWKTKEHHITYEQQFNDVRMSINGTVSGGNYPDLQNASRIKVRS